MRNLIAVSFLLLMLFSVSAFAEEKEENKEPIQYFQIAPNIMTFYQNAGKKLGYVVVQVQIVVRGQDNWDMVELHLPLLQDALIDFFNRQDKATVQDLKLRTKLRNQATQRVAKVLKEETGKDIIEDVLFTQYVFQ